MSRVSNRLGSNIDRIYSKETFTKEFAHLFSNETELSDTDFDVLLTFLSRDQCAIVYDGNVSNVILTQYSSGVSANRYPGNQVQKLR